MTTPYARRAVQRQTEARRANRLAARYAGQIPLGI
jgi:hypothetical protein